MLNNVKKIVDIRVLPYILDSGGHGQMDNRFLTCLIIGVSVLTATATARAEGYPTTHNDYFTPARTIAYEASDQPFAGQVAVASVIKTRMKKRRLSAQEVCLQPCQFSCWRRDGEPSQSRRVSIGELKTAWRAWQAGQVWKYDHYCRIDCYPSWRKYVRESIIIGDHLFCNLSK